MQKILKYVKNNKIEFTTVILITLLALILRVVALVNRGELWYDELFSWSFASRDSVFETIACALREDIHMPLYFVLLHFWMKIFGQYNIEAMRAVGLLFLMPLIPCSYYLTKNLFNKTTAYFVLIYLAINTYCIHYSVEVKFYPMVLMLSFFVAYFFTKMLDNFDKKNTILFIISTSLLFYTFSITPLLVFIYFITGLIYVLIEKKEYFKKYILIALILFVINFPAIFFTVLNAIEMKNAITYYPLDNYLFDGRMIYDFLENFFSLENIQQIEDDTIFYRDMFENIAEVPYFIAVFIPILLGLFGIFRSLFSKNKKLYLFLVPSLLFLIIMYILSIAHLAVVQTRYLAIIFPVLICALCYGFTCFKNEIVTLMLYMSFILLNLLNLLLHDSNIFNLQRVELAELRPLFQDTLEINSSDYILAPVISDKLRFYAHRGTIIPFSAESAFVIKGSAAKKMYFGDDYKKIKRDNVRGYLYDFVIDDRPLDTYEKNLYEKYLKNLKKGQRVILMSFYGHQISHPFALGINPESYYSYNLPALLYSKSTRDSYLILSKYLKEVRSYPSSYGYITVVFEKE